MIEDDIYRSSSQYRVWSFTPESLASLRQSTNELAADRVRAALKRVRENKKNEAGGDENGNGVGGEKQIDCLTVEEEAKLVIYYCELLMRFGESMQLSLPTTVRATAVQYLRRFYLTNSPMTYHPKTLMFTSLFLATKTDNYFVPLNSFVEQVAQQDKKTTAEDIIAPEFLLTQGLRFMFDIRHPFRGLEGGVMELLAIVEGQGDPGPNRTQTAAELQNAINKLAPGPKGALPIKNRIAEAHTLTKELLKNAALFTDAYFLYTPSQIWMSAFMIADEPLAQFYIDTKVPSPPAQSNFMNPETEAFLTTLASIRPKLLATLSSCAALLRSYTATSNNPDTMKELRRIGKKLYQCQNPEKMDIVAMSKAQKREDVNEEELEAARKKRKLEREMAEQEAGEVFGFGGELKK